MKKLIYYCVILIFCCYACKQKSDEATPDKGGNNADKDIRSDTPCSFNISEVAANTTLSIDCLLDLKGETIVLPQSVSFEFAGGDIINGTLKFSGGQIDGRLLSSKLTIEGDVKLNTTTFEFVPSRWDVTEGQVANDVALTNRENINKTIELIKQLKGEIFELGKMDIYFNVEANKLNRKYMTDRAIRIPSDFHFKMSDETFLRVQPTHFPAYYLLSVYLTNYTTVSGGNLIGDRYKHDYTPIKDIAGVDRSEHGWGFLIGIIGAHDAIVERVRLNKATGDGLIVSHKVIRNPDGTLTNGNRTSERVLIKNCIIKEARRNGIAVTDANGITIDNCQIIDTGKGEQAYDAAGNKIFSSAGTLPKYGIDLEPSRIREPDGTLLEYQRVENITIRNSTFKGNEFGDIVNHVASNVLIEKNFFDKWVAGGSSHHITIRDNVFESRFPVSQSGIFAINIKSNVKFGEELVHDFVVSGNQISGYSVAIIIGADKQEVVNNTITNCATGITFGKLSNSLIKDNIISSNLSQASYGYRTRKTVANNVVIEGGSINVTNRPIDLHGLNKESVNTGIEVIFKNVELNTTSANFSNYIIDSKNIMLKNCKSNTRLEKVNSSNIIDENSTFKK